MLIRPIIKAIENEQVVAPLGVAINTSIDLPETSSFDCQPFGFIRSDHFTIECDGKVVGQKTRIGGEARGSLCLHELLG